MDNLHAGSAESLELQHFTRRWNAQIQNQGGSMTCRKLGDADKLASRKWKESTCCLCGAGRVASHVPDASAGGPAVPLDWMAQLEAANSYVGGIGRHLPLGYTYDTVKKWPQVWVAAVAGLTGFCGLARAIAKMPWNKRVGSPADSRR